MKLAASLTGPTRVNAAITSAADRYGVSADALRVIAQIESVGKSDAKNPKSTAGGLFQFIDSTAKQYGLSDKFDPDQAADAGARLMRDNATGLRAALGREPTTGELYLAHQQGLGGARKLLRDPSAMAVDVVGRDAVKMNGGDENMTAAEFAALWTGKADRLAGSPGASLSGGGGDDTLAGGDLPTLDDLLATAQPATQMPSLDDLLAPTEPAAEMPGPLPVVAYDPGAPVEPQKPKDFFDITGTAVAPYREMLSATGASIMGTGPSVAGAMLPEDTPGRQTVGRVLDLGLAPLSVAGMGYGAMVGGAADVLEGAGMESAPQLARDLLAMPEAFAGSPGQFAAAPARVARGARPSRAVSADAAQEAFDALPVEDQRRKIGETFVRAQNGNRAAQEEIVRMARVQPEAAQAADRLGIDVPVDVLGDNTRLKEITAALRTQMGSEASEAWDATISEASRRAYDVIRDQGTYGDIASVSDQIRRDLQSSVTRLENAGRPVFREIEQMLPGRAQVVPTASVKTINEFLARRSGPHKLKGASKELFDAVTDEGGLTYHDLQDLKQDVGRAIARGSGPYADANQAMLKRVYGSIVEDQNNHIRTILGDEAGDRIAAANASWAQAREVEDLLTQGFGKNHDGSIATALTRSLTQGGKGDVAMLDRTLRVVPEGLRRDAVLAGIDELAKSKRGPNSGQFSFQEYQKTWSNLKRQKPVMDKLQKTLGADAFQALDDLATVSRKVQSVLNQTQAGRNTGKSVLAEAFVDGMFNRIMDTTSGRTAASIGAGAVGAAGANMAGGPALAMMAGPAVAAGVSSMRFGGKKAKVASELFKSPEFNRFVLNAAKNGGQPASADVSRLQRSARFKRWARLHGIDDPNTWLAGSIAAAQMESMSDER